MANWFTALDFLISKADARLNHYRISGGLVSPWLLLVRGVFYRGAAAAEGIPNSFTRTLLQSDSRRNDTTRPLNGFSRRRPRCLFGEPVLSKGWRYGFVEVRPFGVGEDVSASRSAYNTFGPLIKRFRQFCTVREVFQTLWGAPRMLYTRLVLNLLQPSDTSRQVRVVARVFACRAGWLPRDSWCFSNIMMHW